MRAGTAVFILVLIVLLAAYGWKALGWLAAGIVLVILLGFLLAVVAMWTIKRRMRRSLQAFMAQAMRHRVPPSAGAREPPRRAGAPGVIDVEATDARDEGRV